MVDGEFTLNTLLNSSQNCDRISINLRDFNELLRRIETLEKIIIENRRAVLRQELAQLEDGMKLERTIKRRVR